MGRMLAYTQEIKDYIYKLYKEKKSNSEIIAQAKQKFKHVKGMKDFDDSRATNLLYRIRKEHGDVIPIRKSGVKPKVKRTPMTVPSLDTPQIQHSSKELKTIDVAMRPQVNERVKELRELGFTWQSVREELMKEFSEYYIPSGSALAAAVKASEKREKRRIKKQKGIYKIEVTNPEGNTAAFTLNRRDAVYVTNIILEKIKNTVL